MERRRYAINYEGRSWSSEDITAGEAALIATLTGEPWEAILDPTGSPAALVANILARLVHREGADLLEEQQRLERVPLVDLLTCYVPVEREPVMANGQAAPG